MKRYIVTCTFQYKRVGYTVLEEGSQHMLNELSQTNHLVCSTALWANSVYLYILCHFYKGKHICDSQFVSLETNPFQIKDHVLTKEAKM